MNKKVLGVLIPYYKNSEECEVSFKKLMEKINKQLTDDMILFIYEDGQASHWLLDFKDKGNIIIKGNLENKGVSHARNIGIDYLINKVEYIAFLDADDTIDDNYLKTMYEYCADMTHEIIEATFYVNNAMASFDAKKVRSGCAGSAIKTSAIGNHRFDETLQIGEDTKFMNEVCDLSKYRKKHANTNYIYQYGINNNSLIKKYNRDEIEKER